MAVRRRREEQEVIGEEWEARKEAKIRKELPHKEPEDAVEDLKARSESKEVDEGGERRRQAE